VLGPSVVLAAGRERPAGIGLDETRDRIIAVDRIESIHERVGGRRSACPVVHPEDRDIVVELLPRTAMRTAHR